MEICTQEEFSKDFIKNSESRSQSKIKTRALIKNLVKETIGNETSQAIIRIFETKNISLKIFWLLQ